jgi:DNA-binding response OmpR family regulator
MNAKAGIDAKKPTVLLVWPRFLSRRRGPDASMETASNKRLQGRRVLVVEDDAFVAFDIMKPLREAGAEVLGPAFSLGRALELATSEDLDCAILDVILRDGSVFPAARLLRQRGAGLVFYTGRFDLGRLKLAWPGAQVLLKPASPNLLVQATRAACSQ